MNKFSQLFNANIVNICGQSDNTISLESIANDPNFVFTNDPNYETKVLYFSDGSIINVNSWIECANYVNGGWTDNMSYLQNMEGHYVAFIGIITLITLFIKRKKLKQNNLTYSKVLLIILIVAVPFSVSNFTDDTKAVELSEDSLKYYQTTPCKISCRIFAKRL